MRFKKIIIFLIIPIFLICLISCFKDSSKNKYYDELKPVIVGIETYIKKNKHYPKDLNDLIPEYLQSLPKLKINYTYKIHGKFYIIYFKKSSSQYCVYWSKTKQWYISDFTEWPEE